MASGTSVARDQNVALVKADTRLPAKRPGFRLVSAFTHSQAGHSRIRWRLISFLLIVVIPTALAAAYYYGIASDQFVSEFRFALRSSDPQPTSGLALLQGSSATSQIASDSNAIVQFIESREVVDELESKINVRAMFSRPDIDILSSIDPRATVERVVEYWRKHVEAYYELMTGTVIVRVRAFTSQDAFLIANTISNLSEKLVNNLSARAREGAVAFADTEVARAERRMAAAQAAMRQFRDKEQVLDPRRTAEATLILVGKLRDELSQKKAEMASLSRYMNSESPTMQFLSARTSALEGEITRLGLGVTGAANAEASRPDPLSGVITGYETVETERQFAERYYTATLELLQKARGIAEQQHLYLASFVRPSVAEEALYPQRTKSVVGVLAVAMSIWVLFMIGVASIRDHLG